MKKISIIILFTVQFFASEPAFSKDKLFPAYRGYVNDYVEILSPEIVKRVEAICMSIEQKTMSQVAILTINSTYPYPLEEYAVRLFKQWGIGQRERDNGVLILIAVKDRSIRIEVGYGLEGIIPDAIAKDIIENDIIPSFKRNDYNKGILKGVARVGRLIAREYNVEIPELDDIEYTTPTQDKTISFDFLFLLFIIIISMVVSTGLPLLWFMPPSERRYYSKRNPIFWGNSGPFGGGFGGFGGGISGGGGASGSW